MVKSKTKVKYRTRYVQAPRSGMGGSSTIIGLAALGGIGAALYFYFRKKGGTITVNVSAPGATWTISGPQSYSGTGSITLENFPEGSYTIAFGDVTGYVTPASDTQTLIKDGSITFVGGYIQEGLAADITNVEIV